VRVRLRVRVRARVRVRERVLECSLLEASTGEGEGEGEGFGMFATRGIHESFHPTTPNLLYMQWCALITQYSLGTHLALSVSGSPVSLDWWDAIPPTIC
jgi:hypothetical protein